MGFTLSAIHVNHGVRGRDADLDEDFVRNMCKKANVSLRIARLVFRKGERASEDLMRQKRLGAIRDCARETGACAAVLGHHQDDLAETFLMRLLKGSGLKGLSGFREYSLFQGLPLLRPMRNISRKDILLYLKQNLIKWREDHTNRDPTFYRNKLRHKLIPLLEREYNPAIKQILAHCADHFSGVHDYLKCRVESILRQKVKKASFGNLSGERMRIENLVSLPKLMRTEFLRFWIMDIFPTDNPPGSREINALDELICRDQSGTLVRLSGGLIAYRDYESILFIQASLPRLISREKIIENVKPLLLTMQNEEPCHPFFMNAVLPLKISSKDLPQKDKAKFLSHGNLKFRLSISKRCLKEGAAKWVLPLGATKFPIEIRTRKANDRVRFKGMTKPLKKWLEEQRIPAPLRDHIAILCNSRGNILRAGKLTPLMSGNPIPPFLIIGWESNES
jgi:tRNA(Ile)-lysidine synthetase-like protein